MKILCLIIDSHGPWYETYATHRRLWNAVLDRTPDVEGYFLRSDPNIATDCVVEGRRFVVRGAERYDTILAKSLKAVEVLLGDHAYVLRTNLSSLYDFPLLRRMNLPTTNCYAGCVALAEGISYVSGSGMLLSPDVARKLFPAPDPSTLNPWDDVAIGQILGSRGVPLTEIARYDWDYSRSDDQVEVGRYVQYRLRDQDQHRIRERAVAEQLFARVYP
jgi:hypothetical protein